MSNINIPAVASGAFLGLMALAALIWCFPPITRFLGDLCCCPWRIPFMRKKRRNADEEMDKDDLPYPTGEPHAGTPVDIAGYQRMSAAYMSKLDGVLSITEVIVHHKETSTGEITPKFQPTMQQINMVMQTMGHTSKSRKQTWRTL